MRLQQEMWLSRKAGFASVLYVGARNLKWILPVILKSSMKTLQLFGKATLVIMFKGRLKWYKFRVGLRLCYEFSLKWMNIQTKATTHWGSTRPFWDLRRLVYTL